MILADTSAWVEYDRATGSPTDECLTDLIRGGGEGLAVTEPVMMELLAGARTDEQSNDLRRLLTSFEWITADVVADFEGAALLYRRCRSAGVTPRGLVDCMIATIALRTGAEILALDGDFNAIAEIVPLRLSRSD